MATAPNPSIASGRTATGEASVGADQGGAAAAIRAVLGVGPSGASRDTATGVRLGTFINGVRAEGPTLGAFRPTTVAPAG